MTQHLDPVQSANQSLNKENEDTFKRLSGALNSQRMICFVGAGISASEGFPTWDNLLLEMEKVIFPSLNCPLDNIEQRDLLRQCRDKAWRAEEYRMLMRPHEYDALISRLFDRFPPEPSTYLKSLVQLPFKHFVTTNFDRMLEKTHESIAWKRNHEKSYRVIDWSKEAELHEFISTLGEADVVTPRCYVYLHGRVNNLDAIVLSDRDYLGRYVRSDDTRRKLFALFATHRVAFFGFSLSDPDFISVLREIHTSMGQDNPRHFAVLPYDRDVKGDDHPAMARRRLKRKFGVDPIFYPVVRGRHTALEQLVEKLAGKNALFPKLRLQTTSPSGELPPESVEPDPDDPHKGQFGGSNAANGRQLTAKVGKPDDGWYPVTISVHARDKRKLKGAVNLYLHPTFDPDVRTAEKSSNELSAHYELWTYGAFTVGAEADNGKTRLEFDLAKAPGATAAFRAG